MDRSAPRRPEPKVILSCLQLAFRLWRSAELGLSSLEIVELLVRTDEILGVHLDSSVLATVEAPRAGSCCDVDLLVGTNAEEFRLFLVPAGALDSVDDAVLAGAATGYGIPLSALDVYRRNRPEAGAGDLLAAVATDFFFRVPALRAAEARFEGPGRTYMYEFHVAFPAVRREARRLSLP